MVVRRLRLVCGCRATRRSRISTQTRAPFGHPAPDSPVAEEFVTLLLLEIRADGEVHALNCGHPWPYRITGVQVEPLTRVEPLPPLGPFPLPAELPAVCCGHLVPGEALFLHTDGVEDARDGHGRFFSTDRRARTGRPRRVRDTAVRAAHRLRPAAAPHRWPARRRRGRTRAAQRPHPGGTAGRRTRRTPGAPPHVTSRPRSVTCAGSGALRCSRRAGMPRHAVRPATECRAGGRADGADVGRRTVRGGAGGPAGLLRGISVNRLETLRNSARTLRIRALRSHPV
ncbi:SpoIIE family protein phosphatase [Streptomyces sp. TRM68367]|uniref:SpoIIE family protein phosphatase n=1 Tax=Streptomyces sp. TRM68367 TaxID=2758415 RepID=UPI0037DDDC3E